jgi:tetratricopeptide (TPR) repeat protein
VSEQIHATGHHAIGRNLLVLANILRLRGEYEAALENGEKGLRILQATLKEDSPQLADAFITLGITLRDMGDLVRARPLIERGTAIRERLTAGPNAHRADDLHTLARLCHEEGRYEEAERLYLASAEMAEDLFGPEHPFVVRAREDFARMLRETG